MAYAGDREILGKPAEIVNFSLADDPVWVSSKGGNDSVTGSHHDDILDGGTGSDTLTGGDGDDRLKGSLGNDVLVGGGGADTFLFGFSSRSGEFEDTILDYENGTDFLRLMNFGNSEVLAFVSSVEELVALEHPAIALYADSGDTLISVTNGTDAYSVRLANLQIDGLPPVDAPETDAPPMQIVVSLGQSLAAGVTKPDSEGAPQWLGKIDPDRALELDFDKPRINDIGWGGTELNPATFRGFRPLETDFRVTHAPSMIAQVLKAHDTEGTEAPTYLHFSAARGGRSILELMSGSDFTFGSVEDAMAATGEGDVFAVVNPGGGHDYYVNYRGQADFYVNKPGNPAFYDNLVAQLQLAADTARAEGYALTDKLALAFIQGQSDAGRGHPAYDYAYLLETYAARIDAAADDIFGKDVEIVLSVTQHSGFGVKTVSIKQLEVIENNDFAHLGALEYEFQSSDPARIGKDYTHLSRLGYAEMGQNIGQNLYRALEGTPDAPILISGYTWIDAVTLEISFSGIEGHLVVDPGIYPETETLVTAPETLGFELYDDRGKTSDDLPEIVTASVTAEATVTLEFDKALLAGRGYRLFLGRTDASEQDTTYRVGDGSPLRDSETVEGALPPGGDIGDVATIYEYAPIQYVDITGYNDFP